MEDLVRIFFSETLFTYLNHGPEGIHPSVAEIIDVDIRNEIETIENSKNLDELQDSIMKSTFMSLAGFQLV